MTFRPLPWALMAAGAGAIVALSGTAAANRPAPAQRAPAPAVRPQSSPTPPAAPQPNEPGARLEVPPPPFSDGIYPCSNCHSLLPVNRTRRVLTFHDNIVLKHDEQHRWCLDCHDATNRDVLHLANGDPLPFDRSYELCGQCHGEKLRDWKAGVHGRRTGYWNGEKQYLLCVHCHSPHEPHFKPLQPKPAPIPPSRPK